MNIEDQPKIRVVVRKRPMNKKELGRNQSDVVEVRGGASVIVRQMKQKVDLTKFIDQHHFNFDSAFDQTATNQTIYQDCVRPIVQCAFLGAKVTCFAYGQTGSGKTYTMNGDPGSKTLGMYILGAQDIFNIKDQPEFKHLTVSMSFYQIYCGKLFDLLNGRETLQAREDAKQNVNIIGLTQKKIGNVGSFMQVIEQGSSVRITSQNSTNADSSRSHAIMQISLLDGKKLFGKISFIDLAGCQRGADTIDQNKQTRIDGAQINKSLLALKQCIRALDCGKAHTPFRGSKLTMVLKDSFTGFCRTLMIGNISPNSSSCQNTLNTLRYADRVKQLKKPGGGQPVSKQDQLAKELMLPRMMRNKQTVELNSDGEQSPPKTIHTAPQAPVITTLPQPVLPQNIPTPPPPAAPFRNKKIEEQKQKSQRDASQNHMNPMGGANRNKRILKQQNIQNYGQRRGASVLQKPRNNPITNNFPVGNLNKKKSQRPSFTNNTYLLNRPNTGQNYQRQDTKPLKNPWKPPHQQSTQLLQSTEYNQWESILEEFRSWQPQHQDQIEQMSGKFETLVNYIMRQQLEVLELHKSMLQTQKHLHNQQLKLYNSVLQQDKTNEEFLSYAQSLQRISQRKTQMLANLRSKLASYKYHLKQHQLCEKKLFSAGDRVIQQQNQQSPQAPDTGLLFDYPPLPSSRQYQNNPPVHPHNNFIQGNSNYNSNTSAYTSYPQPFANPQLFANQGHQQPFISQFTSNHSALVDRYGIGQGQLFQNKSDFY